MALLRRLVRDDDRISVTLPGQTPYALQICSIGPNLLRVKR
jgi:hypothetical protein